MASMKGVILTGLFFGIISGIMEVMCITLPTHHELKDILMLLVALASIILSQICSIYVLDQANFSIFNSFTPIMLSILSFLLVRGLKMNAGDKAKLCLVKTIGKHDAVFLILLYGLVVLILSTVDFFATSYWGALGAIFFLHALIIFPGLMES